MSAKIDNSMVAAKAELRRRFLPERARVLYLFCGLGNMYHRAYRGRVDEYHGVDMNKVHDRTLCELGNNERYVRAHNLGRHNVFDLDDWGCPWKLLYLILAKQPPGEITVFVTDGIAERMKLSGAPSKFVSATERIRRSFTIPGILRWYPEIFATMLLDLKRRYGWETVSASYFHNPKHTVYYWALKMRKR